MTEPDGRRPPVSRGAENSDDPNSTIAARRAYTVRSFRVGGVILGRYRIIGELGRGGLGVVYRCFDEVGGIEVALKALPPELSRDSSEMEEVRENFQLVQSLHHPNIAALKTLERAPETGDCFLIMECVEGMDLRHWRKRKGGKLGLTEVISVLRQAATALQYAHSRGIVHRDVKSSNIMVSAEGAVKVLDFGLAAQIHTSLSNLTAVKYATSGTGPYMAPEQWRGWEQDSRTDQYGLAVTAYELLAGKLPFVNPDPAVLRESVLNDPPRPIPGLERKAWAALARALAKKPGDRFKSCEDFVAALGGTDLAHKRRFSFRASGWRWAAAAVLTAALFYPAYRYYQAVSGRKDSEKEAHSEEWQERQPVEPATGIQEQLPEIRLLRSRMDEALKIDPGQGLGELQIELVTKWMALNLAYQTQYWEAAVKSSNDVRRIASQIIALDEGRKLAKAQLAKTRQKKYDSEQILADRAEPEIWREAEEKEMKGERLYEDGLFKEAAAVWREAAEGYRLAQYSGEERYLIITREKYEAALAAQNTRLLRKYAAEEYRMARIREGVANWAQNTSAKVRAYEEAKGFLDQASLRASKYQTSQLQLIRGRYLHAAVTDGQLIYVIGGEGESGLLGCIEAIDPQTGDSKVITNDLIPRKSISAVIKDQVIYIVGGVSRIVEGNWVPEPAVETFDLRSRMVNLLPPLPTPRALPGAVLIGENIVVIGGAPAPLGIFQSGGERTSRVEVFDIREAAWREGPPMPTARECSVVLANGKVYAIGGFAGRPEASRQALEVFDPEDESWEKLEDVPFPLSGQSSIYLDGKIFTFGDFGRPDRLAAYDINLGRWYQPDVLYQPSRHNASVLIGEEIFVTGGRISSDLFIDSVQRIPVADLLESDIEIRLEYSTDRAPWKMRYTRLKLSPTHPPLEWILPPIKGQVEERSWGKMRFGTGTEMKLVAYRYHNSKRRPEVYFTVDADVDFSSVKPLKSAEIAEFIIIYDDGAQQPYGVRFISPKRSGSWLIGNASSRAGKFNYAGDKYRVKMRTDNPQGLYSDLERTSVAITTDGKDWKISQASSPLILGSSNRYSIELEDDGSWAVLRLMEKTE